MVRSYREGETAPTESSRVIDGITRGLQLAVAKCYSGDTETQSIRRNFTVATTSPARIDDDLYASAKLAGGVQSRSASQQVVHWARIGREIEASASTLYKEIAQVLAGSRSYDSLSAKEQAVIRAEWSSRMDTLRTALNLAEEFSGAGRSWVELDEDGSVVRRSALAPDIAPLAGRQDGDHQELVEGVPVASGSTVTSSKVAKAGVKNSKGSGAHGRVSASGRRSGSRSGG
jgi:hypothetical protein